MPLSETVNGLCFNLVHQNNLVYNTCWEDPRLDRQALRLGPNDTVLVITSAGCNVLDYVLQGPKRIFAVDMNHRQNALLELKIAGIRNLDFADFFALFGAGRHRQCEDIYRTRLRTTLSPAARYYWDRRIEFFAGVGKRPSFYFRGTSGFLAWIVNSYIDRVAKVRPQIERILAAKTLDEQRAIYQGGLYEAFWSPFLRWVLDRDATLSLLGVPLPQRQQLERSYSGGIVQFIHDRIEEVFCRLPLRDNYFWRVYLTGRYTAECCPEYLKPDNFKRLKAGLVDRIRVHTGSILDFLTAYPRKLSRFVLLDHMDWLSTSHRRLLQKEWQSLFDKAEANARFLWRSGGLRVDYINPLEVTVRGKRRRLGDLLAYDRKLAETLHAQDRVHTYGSFHIADLAA